MTLHEAIERYDAACNRDAIAARVKELRASGVHVTEIRERLDAQGVPRRMELIARHSLVWHYDREDFVQMPRLPRGPVPPGHYQLDGRVTVMPDDDEE